MHRSRLGHNATPVTAGLSPPPQSTLQSDVSLTNSNTMITHTSPQSSVAIEGMKTFINFIETAGPHAAASVTLGSSLSNGSLQKTSLTFASGVDGLTGSKTPLLHEHSDQVLIQEGNADAFAALARQKLRWSGEYQTTTPQHNQSLGFNKSPPSFTTASGGVGGCTGPESSPSTSSVATIESSLSNTPTIPFRFPPNIMNSQNATPPLSGGNHHLFTNNSNRSPFSITSTKTNFRAEYSSAHVTQQPVFLRPPSPSTLLKPPSPNTILNVIDPRSFNAKLQRETSKAQSPSSHTSASGAAARPPSSTFLSAPLMERQISTISAKTNTSIPSPQLSWTAVTPNMSTATRVQSAQPSPHTLSETPYTFAPSHSNHAGGGYFYSKLLHISTSSPTDTPSSSNSSSGALNFLRVANHSRNSPPSTPPGSLSTATPTARQQQEAAGFDARLDAIVRVLNNTAIRKMMEPVESLSDTEAAHRQSSSENEAHHDTEIETQPAPTTSGNNSGEHAPTELTPLQILNGLRRIVRLRAHESTAPTTPADDTKAPTQKKHPLLFTLQFPVANRRVNLLTLLCPADPTLETVHSLTEKIMSFDQQDGAMSGHKRPRVPPPIQNNHDNNSCRGEEENDTPKNANDANNTDISQSSGSDTTATTKRNKTEDVGTTTSSNSAKEREKDPHIDDTDEDRSSSAAHEIPQSQLAKAIGYHIELLSIFVQLVERFAYVIVACLQYPNHTSVRRAPSQPTITASGAALLGSRSSSTTPVGFPAPHQLHQGNDSTPSGILRRSPPQSQGTALKSAVNSPKPPLSGPHNASVVGGTGLLPSFTALSNDPNVQNPSADSTNNSRQQSEALSFHTTPILAENRGSSVFYDPEVAAVMSNMNNDTNRVPPTETHTLAKNNDTNSTDFGLNTTSVGASLNASASSPPPPSQHSTTLGALGEAFAMHKNSSNLGPFTTTTAHNSLGTSFGLPLPHNLSSGGPNNLFNISGGYPATPPLSGYRAAANNLPCSSAAGAAAAIAAARARANSRATTPQIGAHTVGAILNTNSTASNNTSAILAPFAGTGSNAPTPMMQPLGAMLAASSSSLPPTPLSRSTAVRPSPGTGMNAPLVGRQSSSFRLPEQATTPQSEHNSGLAIEITPTGFKLVSTTDQQSQATGSYSASNPSPDSPPKHPSSGVNVQQIPIQQLNLGDSTSIPSTPQRLSDSLQAPCPANSIALSPSLLAQSGMQLSPNNMTTSFRQPLSQRPITPASKNGTSTPTPQLCPNTPMHHTTPLQCGKYISLESCKLTDGQRRDLKRQRDELAVLWERLSLEEQYNVEEGGSENNRTGSGMLKFSSRTQSSPVTPTETTAKPFGPKNPVCEEVVSWWKAHTPRYCVSVGIAANATPVSNVSFSSATPASIIQNDTMLPPPTTPKLTTKSTTLTPTQTNTPLITPMYSPLVFDLVPKGRETLVPLCEMSQFVTLAIQRIDHLLLEQQIRDQVLVAGFSGPNRTMPSNRGMMEPE